MSLGLVCQYQDASKPKVLYHSIAGDVHPKIMVWLPELQLLESGSRQEVRKSAEG